MSRDTRIRSVDAWEVLDSRGRPTVAAAIGLNDGSQAQCAVPSGASTGQHEAHELRDGDERYGGYGVRRAAENVRGEIAAAVTGLPAEDQEGLDAVLRNLDGTAGLARLGANAVLAVSVTAAVAAASSRGIPLYESVADPGQAPLLPLPMVNIISGGAHAGRAIDVQDFLAVPVGATSFSEAIDWAGRVRAGTAESLRDAGFGTALVADEGGLSASLPSNVAALDALVAGIKNAGLRPGDDVGIAIDVAATQFFQQGKYILTAEGRELTAAGLVDELAAWCREYPIVSLEDALADDDWDGWALARRNLTGRQILGDDLFVTDPERLRRGVATEVANAVLVKPNQTGTLSTAREVVGIARDAGFATVLSARSGETEDSWLADLSVGWRTGQIKVGSTMRSERTSKWNRLLRIEHELGGRAEYAGAEALSCS